MTADELRAALAELRYSSNGFAVYIGANPRTVRRWVNAEQDIPPWVQRLIELMRSEFKRSRGRKEGS